MTIKTWLEIAIQDAERRGLPELKPLLEALARATSSLRTAEWNADATGEFESESRTSLDSARDKPNPESRNVR
jgi:hypothetical protein